MNDTIIANHDIKNITVIIDDKSPNIFEYFTLFQNLTSNYNNIADATTNIMNYSSLYLNQNEIDRLNLIIPLSAKWEETYNEVNTIQYNLSSSWQNTTEIINSGIVNGGFF